MNREYFAHSENDNNEKHLLAKHLIEAASLAESFTCDIAFKPIFKIAGLLHDLGKYQIAFQNYLENGGRRGSVPHASWGAGYAKIHKSLEASIAIDGHHKGLPDKAAWKSDTNPYVHDDVSNFEDVVKCFLMDVEFDESAFSVLNPISFNNGLQRELFIRYLFSALTDADWLSTENHFEPERSALRSARALPVDMMIDKLSYLGGRGLKQGGSGRSAGQGESARPTWAGED